MRITAVETFPIVLPLVKPIQMAHMTIERSENVLVKISTDEGVVGWGEGVEATDLTGDNQGRIEAGIRYLASRIIGEDPLRRTDLWLRMQRMIHGNETAIGAIDIALHDLAGQAHGVPVTELLGGATRTEIASLTMVGSGHPDADGDAARAKYEAGYRWFKIKLGIADPDTELKTVTNIVQAVGSDAVIGADANQGWAEHQANRFLRAIDGLPIRFLEQPTTQHDRDALLRVAAASPIPICADQSVHSFDDILGFGPTAIAGVSLKLVKLGGITGVMRGAALCDALHLSINLAGKIAESSVAGAANLHCAAAMSDFAFGCSPGNQGIAADVVRQPLQVTGGVFPVPSGPGLGIEIDEDQVAALAP